MPFGLRFKRTRRYDISTKNIYMVEVQMLDGSFLECTLTSDSTGHECLDGIAQKIELQEDIFGYGISTKNIYMVEVQMLDGSFLECTLTSDSTGHECLDGIAQKIELQERTHRYDISTKNIYIVEVQMLDGSFLECTLTSDSTVHECLDGIAQKIELQEIHYFGLRYVTKKLQFRWVDLTKPLKKQLEKYAQSSHSARSPRLYFGVIFYIANAHKIVDDVARYQYYLQLKTDIVDGRLPLTVDQVIRLAAYSLQVEFRDYESDRLPSDYFTDNLVFPKNLTKDENILSELMSEVLQAYISLQGVQPVKAEILYMREIQMMDGYGMEYYVAKVCISLQGVQPVKAEILYMREIQMMDGYGMEYYVAKDEKGKELYLGTSYVGIFARYLDGQPPIFFKWTDIVKLQQSKKTFEIDTSKSSSVQFSMEDSDTAKYLKRMCILQQKFYKSTKTLLGASLSDVADFTENEVLPDIQQSTYHADSSADPLNQSQTSLQSLKYHEQKYDQDSRSASIHTDEYYSQSQQSLNVSGHDLSSSSHHTDRRASTPSTTSQQQYQHQQYHQQQPQQSQQTNVTTSTPDPKQDPNYAARLAALPAYRHTPDYQAVMRQKMSQSQQQMHLTGNQPGQHQIHDLNQNIADLNQNIADTHIYTQTEEGLAYSQPEIGSHGNSSLTYNHDGHYNFSSPVRAYPHSMSMYTNVFTNQSDYLQYRLTDRPSNLVMQPTYSSPELNTQGLPQSYVPDNYLTVNEALLYQYKPPPPYPRASNSTPDLAVEANRVTISNSPDLVSRKTLGDAVFTRENQPRLVTSTENIVGVVAEPRNSSFNQAGVTRFGNNTDDIQEPIPEVIQISDNVIQTETGLTEVNPDQQEVDDASSDHSNTTFHVNEIDSEPDEPFVRSVPQRQSSKSKIQVRFVAPNKIPPPSTSKDVATRRESFRRMMIARSGSFTPGVLQQKSDRMSYPNRSLREKQTNSVNEYSKTEGESAIKKSETDTTDPIKQNVKNVLNKVSEQSAALRNSGLDPHSQSSPSKEVVRSQSDANRQNKVTIVHEKAVSVDSSAERKQILERLKSSEPEVPTITENENLVGSRERLVDYEDSSDSDQEEEGDGKPMGPLKLAAMNGLAMSRPMVLALMNYETRAPKDERRKILERKLVENLVFKEFEEMPKKIPEYDCTVAKLPENSLRNRFKDVLPYDHSRVKLNPRKDNSSGYINASHMKLSVGQRIWWYIATQAPMDNTPTDFWQMIWEQEVEVIAMLTALAELGRPKCYPYWPQDPGPENKLIFGDFEVQLLFTNDSLCYITNRISLKHLPSKKERQVWHLQYTDWPDHGCPDDMYGFLGFLDEVESVQRLAESEEGSGKKSPIVVHCSAGVGRTGVVILTQVMKWCLEHNQEIDLPKALGLIRQQRMYMVQTLGQYNFIHKTLIQYLKNTRLI